MVKIAVVGGGINGVTCALRIKEKYKDLEVVLISEEFSPNTTGDGSGGLWYPYLCGNTPEHLLTKWCHETYKYIHNLWLEGGHSVCLVPIFELFREGPVEPTPAWAKLMFGYQHLETRQLEYLSQLHSVKYVAGHTFTTFVVRPPIIISQLYHRFSQAGGKVVSSRVSSLRDPVLDEFQVIVNCTGLGARDLVPDTKVFPIRGQISKVTAPWINSVVTDHDSGHYIIPNAEMCVLGGTHQEYDFSTKVDPKDTDFIHNGCATMIPSLKNANILNTWVGLRPGRDEVRLESQDKDGKLIVHNYGHGGSGLTLFWGCASEVLSILGPRLDKNSDITKSKL